MFIITNLDNIILNLSTKLTLEEYDGYSYFVNDKNVRFFNENISVYEVDSMDSSIKPHKYCYTEADGFYINPDWVEPDLTNTYGIPDETYHAIINDLTTEVANSGY